VMGAHPHSPSYDEWYDKLKEARIGEQRLGTPTGSHMFGKPSTGISLIYLLKDLCRSLDVYGFGTHDAAGNPGDYKYYDVMKMSIGQVRVRREKSCMRDSDGQRREGVLGSYGERADGWRSGTGADQLRQERQPRAFVRFGDGAGASDGQGRDVQILPVRARQRCKQPAMHQRAHRHGPWRSYRLQPPAAVSCGCLRG
jgi:hypothetical protein